MSINRRDVPWKHPYIEEKRITLQQILGFVSVVEPALTPSGSSRG